MAWDHLSINKPHLVYVILGGFTSLFMLCSSVIKERLYIGEATVATLCGIIFGPHAANLIDPNTWGNTDQITLEFSRVVLVVQCFAVGVELPKFYMEKHWRSVTLLLIPVMTWGWLVTSLFIWAMFYNYVNWLESLCMAACVTATDPVLASSVVGKGKFAKRVPKHLRDLLSCESGCNDGMAFPFVYLAIYILRYKGHPHEVALHWFCYTILYECLFGAIYGVAIGYIARRLIRSAHERDWIDRESFLVFYFVLALFCAGSGSLLGMDDLLVGFACGVGFSNDGWFMEKTEESHVSNVIDLLINLAFFVYFGTIIPWDQFDAKVIGLDVWRLVVIAILVLFLRRIPIMMILKPVIPDIKTWREALFAGHFGPIGVGAIFVAILARAELESGKEGNTTPLAELPPPPFPHRNVIEIIWPLTAFLVVTSILIHGSSIAVFTLGKHINTMTLTMSYTKGLDDQGWMDRLPRIQSRSKSQMSRESSFDEKGPASLPATLQPGTFLRRQKEEDDPNRPDFRHRSKRSKNWDGSGPGGPVSQSAISPAPRRSSPGLDESRSGSETLAVKSESPPSSEEKKRFAEEGGEIYEEGDNTIFEDEEGNVLAVQPSRGEDTPETRAERERREARRLMHEEGADRNAGVSTKEHDERDYEQPEKLEPGKPAAAAEKPLERPGKLWREGVRKMSTAGWLPKREEERPPAEPKRHHGPARAYQFGNTIIVEDEDGEVIKKYDIPAPEGKQTGGGQGRNTTTQRLRQMSKVFGLDFKDDKAQPGSSTQPSATTEGDVEKQDSQPVGDDDVDLRFATGGRRMSKAEFIDQIRDMDPKRRVQAVENSNAPEAIKREARKEAREHAGLQRTNTKSDVPVLHEHPEEDDEALAAVQRVNSHDSNQLQLVDSGGKEVPFHDISSELRNYSMQSASGETAAERRRRLAAQQPAPDEDSEDDGTERVPPVAGSSNREAGEVGETAAERRRRLGALGHSREDDSDSEDDDEPRESPQASNVRFADGSAPQAAPPARQSTLRWGKNIGR